VTDNWTDATLLEAITTGGQAREAALRHLYLRPGLREAVTRYVSANGGAVQEAQDVFQETLLLFDRNLREGRFEGKSALSTYFIGIAKWHWLSQRRKQGRYTDLGPEHLTGVSESPEVQTLRDEQRDLVRGALAQIGQRCKDLLLLYQQGYSMDEISRTMQYANPDVAKKEAYRCRMRFRELLETAQWREIKE
jgi:RNA polymerase sigma factor (sigma-70 family)